MATFPKYKAGNTNKSFGTPKTPPGVLIDSTDTQLTS